MTSLARSQRLIGFVSTLANDYRRFTCPDGHVTLVKSAVAYNGSAGSIAYSVQVIGPGMPSALILASGTLATLTSAKWEGFVTLNPADFVQVVLSAAGASTWVSGAILSGANQFPPAGQATTKPGDGGPPEG